jgi:predicted metalloprotease with PDZ domain
MRIYFFLFVFLPLSLIAQKIHYEFAAPNASHHEAEITLTVSGLKPGPIFFRMSRSSPGRYATHEFGKNVYNVSAIDANSKSLDIEKTDAEVYKAGASTWLCQIEVYPIWQSCRWHLCQY